MTGSDEVFAWLHGQADEDIETSCARVFLMPGRTLKVKKPVDLGFLDFTTLEKRRWALERELRLNRATAPDIYRAVLPIRRASGRFAVGGEGAGEVVEYALEMRRFDPDAVLARHPERLTEPLADTLGRTIARLHARARPARASGGARTLGYTLASNAEQLSALRGRLGAADVDRLLATTRIAFEAATPLLERRRAEGFARRCHGDLHLGNILLEDGVLKPFDCIEFNETMAKIDVLYDLAFLVMDLWFRGARTTASRALGGYFDEAARRFSPDLWDGLAALPLMLATRAVVRAHVAAHQGADPEARAYLAAALSHLAPPPPRLVAVGGLSGAGKTTFARRIAPDLGVAPGAVILRSDEIRKRLAGVGPAERLAPAAYGPGTSERVYGEMLDIARRVLRAGHAVVLDAVFLRPEERQAAEAVAAGLGVAFDGLWLAGDRALLERRLAGRRGDASDADARVLAEQLGRDPGRIDWTLIDAADPEAAARRLAETPPD